MPDPARTLVTVTDPNHFTARNPGPSCASHLPGRTDMRTVSGSALVAVLFVASGLAVENLNDQPKVHNDAFVAGPANESQAARQIRHNLLMLPYYTIFDDLAFRLNGSVVTLEGACPPEPPWDNKSDAENAVKEVPGVTQVINNIKVLPLSPMDWEIRRAEARAIYGNPEIGMRYGYQALPSIHGIDRAGEGGPCRVHANAVREAVAAAK
jgi:hypothetical protein